MGSHQPLLPRLAYSDAPAAIAFLSRTFGFVETGRFAQGGRVIYSELALCDVTLFAIGSSHASAKSPRELGGSCVELFCYVDDVDRHYEVARAAGATIESPPEDKFWGDRSYSAIDPEGYRWTFRKIVKIVNLPDSRPRT